MAKASAGRVLLMSRGEWASGTAYALMDFVEYNGSSYVCKADAAGTEAPNNDTEHWQLMAEGENHQLVDECIKEVQSYETRVAALETASKDHESRITELEKYSLAYKVVSTF